MRPILEADGLRRCYGAVEALRGLDVSLAAGSITGLLGPDGAGKTTAMRLLTGLIRPDAGTVRLCGRDVTGQRATGGQIGYMPQRFSLYPDLSVDENLRFYADLFGVRRSERLERTERLLEFARLGPFRRRRAAALSGGMKQKLALACTLIHAPDVLLLDEPTTGVDPIARVEFWNILAELRADGTALMVSTPYMDEADRCDTVVMLREGIELDRGTPAGLRARFPHAILEVAARPLGRAMQLLDELPGVLDVVPFGTRIHLTTRSRESRPAGIRSFLEERRIEVDAVVEAEPSMEDVFVALAGTV